MFSEITFVFSTNFIYFVSLLLFVLLNTRDFNRHLPETLSVPDPCLEPSSGSVVTNLPTTTRPGTLAVKKLRFYSYLEWIELLDGPGRGGRGGGEVSSSHLPEGPLGLRPPERCRGPEDEVRSSS